MSRKGHFFFALIKIKDNSPTTDMEKLANFFHMRRT